MPSSGESAVGTRSADYGMHAPIPLLKRHVILDLGGDWHFKVDAEDVGEAEGWFIPGAVRDRQIPVPAPWQFVYDDLRHYVGAAWYERNFSVSEAHRDRRVAVVFIAVDYAAKVWVNGTVVGEHVGGYSPFALDISEQVRFGQENTLTVKVTDLEWVDFNENNHWNVHISGIWRDVWLEETGKVYLSDIHVIPDVDNSMAKVAIEVRIPALAEEDVRLEAVVKAPNGRAFATEEQMFVPVGGRPALFRREVNIRIDDPILWDLDNPALYEVEAKLLDRKGAVVDVASTDFGMRKLEVKGPRIYFNDRPLYLFGGMDLMHVGMNIAPAYQHPTDEEIRHEIALAKELGFNFIRKVGCLEDPRYMYWADRLGMLLMLMPPCMHQVTEESLERWFDEWRALIVRDRNHPSALIWAPFNESFGLYYDGNWDVLPGATARDIVERAYDEGKALDPTRPIIDNSNGHGLGHIKHDIDDGHPYYKLSQYENCKRHMANLRATNRPVVITEFNPHIMAPDLERLKAEWGGKPWWLEESTRLKGMTGYEHSCVHPAGFESRYRQWGLDEVYEGLTDFMERHGWLMYSAIKHQIEQIRKNPDISGFTYTDVYDNVGTHTGVINYWREKKPWSDAYAKLHAPDLVFLDWTRLNCWSGDVFKGEVYISHLSHRPLHNATLHWWLEGHNIGGQIENVSLPDFDAVRLGDIRFTTPQVSEARALQIRLRIEQDGETIAENYQDIYVYPRTYMRPIVERPINVPLWQSMGSARGGRIDWEPNLLGGLGGEPAVDERSRGKVPAWKGMGWEPDGLAYRLSVAGYDVHPGLDPEIPLAIVTTIDDEVDAYMAGGGTVLLVDPDPATRSYLARFGLKFASENGGASESMFIRTGSGIGWRVPGGNPLVWPYHMVFPAQAILGLKPEQHHDMIGGYFGHYITFQVTDDPKLHGPGATIAQFRYKQGRLLVTTFNLFRHMAPVSHADPVAVILSQDLIAYALGAFDPQTILVAES